MYRITRTQLFEPLHMTKSQTSRPSCAIAKYGGTPWHTSRQHLHCRSMLVHRVDASMVSVSCTAIIINSLPREAAQKSCHSVFRVNKAASQFPQEVGFSDLPDLFSFLPHASKGMRSPSNLEERSPSQAYYNYNF